MTGGTVTLADGRTLRWDEHGDPAGAPALFFHGGGHSRRYIHPDETAARERGLRVITVDRPGIGGSSPDPKRTIGSWAADVEGLADELELDSFTVLGHSMGGPFAVAVAAAIPDRVRSLVLVGALPPLDSKPNFDDLDAFNKRLYRTARMSPPLVRLGIGRMKRRRDRDPEAFQRTYYAESPAADRAAAADPELAAVLAESAALAVAQGAAGLTREVVLVAKPWDTDHETDGPGPARLRQRGHRRRRPRRRGLPRALPALGPRGDPRSRPHGPADGLGSRPRPRHGRQ